MQQNTITSSNYYKKKYEYEKNYDKITTVITYSSIILIIFQSIVSHKFDSRIHKYSSIAILVFNLLHIIIFTGYDSTIETFSSTSFLTKDTYGIYENRYRRLIPLLATIILNIIPTIYFVVNSPRTSLESFVYNGIQLVFPLVWYIFLSFDYRNIIIKNLSYHAIWYWVLHPVLVSLQTFQVYWMYNSEVHYNVWLRSFSIIFLCASILLPYLVLLFYCIASGFGTPYPEWTFGEFLGELYTHTHVTLDGSEYTANYTKIALLIQIMIIYIISSLVRDPVNEIDKWFGVLIPYLPMLFLIFKYLFIAFNALNRHDRERRIKEWGIFLTCVMFINYVVAVLLFNLFGIMYCRIEIDQEFKNSDACIINNCTSVQTYGGKYIDVGSCNSGCGPCDRCSLALMLVYLLIGFWMNIVLPGVIFNSLGLKFKNYASRFIFVMKGTFITLCGILLLIAMVIIHRSGIIKDRSFVIQFIIYFPALFPALVLLPLKLILDLLFYILGLGVDYLDKCYPRDTGENTPDLTIPAPDVIKSDIKQNNLDVKEIIPDVFYECKEDLEYDYYIVEDEKYNNIHTSQA
jgi:hypothetical protein